jgi:glycerol-1-phosphate dehydrogenase [NAD(P)+]
MTSVAVPVDLDALRVTLGDDGSDRPALRPIGMQDIVIGSGALHELVPLVTRLTAPGRDVVLLVDATPMRRGDDDLKQLACRMLEAHLPVRLVVLGADRPELHADETALAEADRAIAGAGCVVTVGSGTITDIGKDASHRAGGIPFVVVQTAVSVNAFSDDMAVLLRNGVKRTVPSRWPDALIVDLETIADAPPAMNRAGFAELTAMFTAPADWYLATAFGMDDSYDDRVVRLFRDRGDRFLATAEGVASRDPDTLAELAGLMTISGIAMGVAGRTAPFSGMEHTISHMLDMAAEQAGRPLAFHGAQVGVAAAVVAVTWRRLLDRFDPERLLSPAAYPSPETMRERIEAAFRPLDPTGGAGAECWRDYSVQLERWTGVRNRAGQLARDWPEHRRRIEAIIASPEAIVNGLRQAGAPTRFRDLAPPADEATVRWALRHCHLMRNRFTVADLAFLADEWDEEAVDAVLAEAGRLGGGA